MPSSSGRQAGLNSLEAGMVNVRRHLGIIRSFGAPAVVAINRRSDDTNEELELLERRAVEAGAIAACVNNGFARRRRRSRAGGSRGRGMRAANRISLPVRGR